MIEEDQVADDNGTSENDIPGASLSRCDPSTLTVPTLKRWLLCGAAPTLPRARKLILLRGNLAAASIYSLV